MKSMEPDWEQVLIDLRNQIEKEESVAELRELAAKLKELAEEINTKLQDSAVSRKSHKP